MTIAVVIIARRRYLRCTAACQGFCKPGLHRDSLHAKRPTVCPVLQQGYVGTQSWLNFCAAINWHTHAGRYSSAIGNALASRCTNSECKEEWPWRARFVDCLVLCDSSAGRSCRRQRTRPSGSQHRFLSVFRLHRGTFRTVSRWPKEPCRAWPSTGVGKGHGWLLRKQAARARHHRWRIRPRLLKLWPRYRSG